MKITFAFLILLATAAPIAVAPACAQTQLPPQILAELFCSFGCSNCPPQDDPYYDFLSSHPTYGVVVINYHNSISDPQDEFYLESQRDVDNREKGSYYNISADPSAFIDGNSSGSTYGLWENVTTQDLNPPLGSLAQAPKAVVESDGNIHIIFSATGPQKGTGVVRVAIKESNISYDNTLPPSSSYGNPPGDIWNDIFRAMLPNSSDTTALSAGETRSFDVVLDPNQYVPLLNNIWNTNNMEAVVFVQDVNPIPAGSNNYNIESIGVVSLANPEGVAPSPMISSASIRVVGTPSNPMLRVSLPASDRVGIEISDMLGRHVRVIPEVNMPSGETTVDISGNPLPSGCYFARMIVNGQDAANAKLIVE